MKYIKFIWSVLRHKWFVFRAGLFVGGIPLWRLIIHDWSKFTPTEIFGYAGNIGGSVSKPKWARAWLHHLHCNPHHPEHWVLAWRGNPKFYDDVGYGLARFVTLVPMPETYVREMVADFMGASKAITGSWGIAEWLNSNGPDLHLHDETFGLLDKVFSEIGLELRGKFDWEYIETKKFRDWSKESEEE